MSEPVDMNAPVTRRELYDAISASEHRILEAMTRLFREQETRLDQRLDQRFREHEVECARMFRAIEESLISRTNAMYEPLVDLPVRVRALEIDHSPRIAALERAVFPPPPAKRTRKRS